MAYRLAAKLAYCEGVVLEHTAQIGCRPLTIGDELHTVRPMTNLVRLPQLLEQRTYLTERWVRSMCARSIEEDRLPHYRVGGKLVFDLEEVDAFVRRNHRGPRTATGAEGVLPSEAPTAERDEGSPVAPGEPSR